MTGVLVVLAVLACIVLAMFVVPWYAQRLVRRDAELEDRWAHPHVDREWHEPKRRRARARESETEDHA